MGTIYYINSNELYHFGIQGQKWGVRRYQNEDGSLTDAGRKRYGVDLDFKDKSYENRAKIRKAQANYNLDKAIDAGADKYTIKGLKKNVRKANRAIRVGKTVDKGDKLYNSGKTITSEKAKILAASLVPVGSYYGLTALMNGGINALNNKAMLTEGRHKALVMARDIGYVGSYIAALGYAIKKRINADSMAISNRVQRSTIGGDEYKQAIKKGKIYDE